MPQIGITTTHGITLASGLKPQKVDRVRSVGYSEVPGPDGECLLVKPLKTMLTDVTIAGVGVADLSLVAVGAIATPADLAPLRVENSEVNNARATFTLNSKGHSALGSASTGGSAGAGSPDEHTIEVLSVAYSLTKDCRVSAEMDEAVELTPAGIPGYREGFNRRLPFSASGKGDVPTNVGIGAGGSKHASVTGGATITTSLTDTQEVRAVNGWNFEAMAWPEATAG
jgi:hypothetical protein